MTFDLRNGEASLAKRSEEVFERWGRFVVRNPWRTALLGFGFTVLMSLPLPNLRFDNTPEALLTREDPALQALIDFRQRFPRDDVIVVALESSSVFSFEFLETLRSLHRDLEAELPYTDEVKSLINARHTYGVADELRVEELLESWPQNEQQLQALRERALSNPLYINTLLSADAQFTSITITPVRSLAEATAAEALRGFDTPDVAASDEPAEFAFLPEEKEREIVFTAQRIIERYRSEDLNIYLAGMPVMGVRMFVVMQDDLVRFALLALAVIAGFLFFLFRRLSGMLLPLLIVVGSMTATLGLMAFFGYTMSVVTEILPTFLLVVGVCDSVHILAIFYQRLAAGDEKKDAVVFALSHSGLAILMTSVTTAAGLLSFTTASVKPIAELGLFGPVGVGIAFILTVTVLPAMLVLSPLRIRALRARATEHRHLDRFLLGLGHLGTSHPSKVVLASSALILVALWGALQLKISFHSLAWFPEHEPIRVATERIDEALGGTMALELLIDAGSEGAFQRPQHLESLDMLAAEARSKDLGGLPVGKVTSLVDIVKEIHHAVNEGRPEFHAIPDSQNVVAQELLLFENSGTDDLEEVTDTRFQLARISLRVPRADATRYVDLLEDLRAPMADALGGVGEVTSTGAMTLLARTTTNTATSMLRSYLFAILAITPMMMLLLGSIRMGLVAMIPNLTPIVLALGLMHWLQIPLDATTLLIGSIILGLAVDDTIHFMHKFKRYFEECGDVRSAVDQTLQTTGAALLFTSLVLSAGFFMFLSGYMLNIQHFGLLVGFATLVAFLGDVVLAPALMSLVAQRLLSSGTPEDPALAEAPERPAAPLQQGEL